MYLLSTPVTLTLLVFLKYLFTHSSLWNTSLSINLCGFVYLTPTYLPDLSSDCSLDKSCPLFYGSTELFTLIDNDFLRYCVCVFLWMSEHVVTSIRFLCPAHLTPVIETGSFLELGAHWLVRLTGQWTLRTCLSLTHTQAFMCIPEIQMEVLKLTQQALSSPSHLPRAGLSFMPLWLFHVPQACMNEECIVCTSTQSETKSLKLQYIQYDLIQRTLTRAPTRHLSLALYWADKRLYSGKHQK